MDFLRRAAFVLVFLLNGYCQGQILQKNSQILTGIAQKLWDLDENRATKNEYRIDFQQRTKQSSGKDLSPKRLISNVDENLLDSITYKAFIQLLDNYERRFGVEEDETEYESFEQYKFLNSILRTDVMKEAYRFLKQQDKVDTMCDFRELLERLWFETYSRIRKSNIKDSSGFEHIFVGEVNQKNKVSGFHNWIQFYLLEREGNLNYFGYLDKDRRRIDFASVVFEWSHSLKPIASLFVGTSPEFEIALYTIVYVMGYSGVNFDIDGQQTFKINCFGIDRKDPQSSISSCFPVRSERVSRVFNKLWELDQRNRLYPIHEISYSIQENTTQRSTVDVAPMPFFNRVDKRFFQRPTYKAFIDLLDNYEKQTNVKESRTSLERREEQKFMKLVLSSRVGCEVYNVLKQYNKVDSRKQFERRFYELWFEPYFRSSKQRIIDSSGFEHVFVGELKNSKVSGFHSWIQFYMQEKRGNLNYFGHLEEPKSEYHVTYQFSWFNRLKPIGSMMLGTSPEFDISLYTLVYLMGFSGEPFQIDGDVLKIICFGINKNRSIGTCFPSSAKI